MTTVPAAAASTRRRRRLPPFGVTVSIVILVAFVVTALFGHLFGLPDPYAQSLIESLEGPSRAHPLGTDQLGRDMLSRIVAGSRYSLVIGLGAIAVGALTGVPLGMLAGYQRGWLDQVVTRVIDVFLAFPGIILALVIVAILGPGLSSLVLAVGLRSFPIFARVARAETLALREREYVQGARALGSRAARVLGRHVFPNLASALMVIATLQMATAILIGATLTFLGVGISPELPEWGAMMNAARPYMLRAPLLIVIPGLALMLVMFALNLVGDYVRDRTDPFSAR
jgi:peptide/nickel transport system permease protein